MDFSGIRRYVSAGSGLDWSLHLKTIGKNTVVEDGVRIFHPENVSLGENVLVGHQAHIDGYHDGHVTVGDGSWLGPLCFLHGAAGIHIGKAVGIGPRVVILTSQHRLDNPNIPVLHEPLVFSSVAVGNGCDVGTGAIILPGVTIGEGAVIGAGAVVTRDVPAFSVVAGNPAQTIRHRQ